MTKKGRKVRSQILLSNTTTAKGKEILNYGIPLARRLVNELGLAGLELLLSWLPMAKGWRKLPVGLRRAIHLPWDWKFNPWGWNHQASILANLKGKAQYLTQARTGYALRVAKALDAEYRVVHPGSFASLERIPVDELRVIPGLAFENDWATPGYRGVEAALRFSDWTGGGIVIDTCHLARVAEDAEWALKKVAAVLDRIVAIHVSDYDAQRGEHLTPRWGKEGFQSLPEVLDLVRSAKPDIPMVCEVREGEAREAVEGVVSYLER